MPTIDLNCDMGESYGAWTMGQDAQVLAHVSSANIACGFHAGDPDTMRHTVRLAREHGVAIGAHPSLPDLAGFGRREMAVSPNEAYALVAYQIGALQALAATERTHVAHVKPHGALYNMAARDTALADAIAQAVRDVGANLLLVGLAHSELTRAGERAGLAVLHEAFCDRAYEADGTLSPRREAGAVITDPALAVTQAVALATTGDIVARDGTALHITANTLCVHGDKPNAAEFAQRLHAALVAAGLTIAAPNQQRHL